MLVFSGRDPSYRQSDGGQSCRLRPDHHSVWQPGKRGTAKDTHGDCHWYASLSVFYQFSSDMVQSDQWWDSVWYPFQGSKALWFGMHAHKLRLTSGKRQWTQFSLMGFQSRAVFGYYNYVYLKMLGLYIDALEIGQFFFNVASILNEVSLQKEFQDVVTNYMVWTKK